jgi:hypothetical protein
MSSHALRAALASVAVGCGDPTEVYGTSVRVWADFGRDVQVTQLEFCGHLAAGAAFGPVIRPERAMGLLQSGGELLVLLPDSLDRSEVTCQVQGLYEAKVVAMGSSTTVVQRGRLGDCRVSLTLPLPVPCSATSCAGCCTSSGVCEAGTEATACGRQGDSCRACRSSNGEACVQGDCRN